MLTAAQVEQLARVADEFGGGKGHLTTRQNIQYHFVPLARVADLMHVLADAGLTNREACYNTVRNVTTCAWAGIARDEVFDVRPYAQRVAYAFLRKDLTSNLPRKFKIAFDGCAGRDCIAGAINDIGLRAVIRDGRRGFRMLVGGGLGPLPIEAQLLDEFVPEERLLNRCEAVIRVFNQLRQPQEQEQGADEIRAARARLRMAARADRKGVSPTSWRTAASPGRRWCRRVSADTNRSRNRSGRARCCRWSGRYQTGDADYDALARNQRCASRSRPVTPPSPCAWSRAI